MNRLPLLAFLLVPALAFAADPVAPVAPPSLDVQARVAAPAAVIDAFSRLCLRPEGDAAAHAAAQAMGGRPVADAPKAPPGVPVPTLYDLAIDGVQARVGFGPFCMLGIEAAEVAGTTQAFDRMVDAFDLTRKLDLRDGSAPAGAQVLRDLQLQLPDHPLATRLQLIVRGGDGRSAHVYLMHALEAPAPAAAAAAAAAPTMVVTTPPPLPAPQSADFAPSEDVSGRGNHPPRFPEAAIAACAHGVVRVRVTVDASGNVLDSTIESSSGNAALDAEAQESARHWRFNPGKAYGQPIGGEVIVPVNFADPC